MHIYEYSHWNSVMDNNSNNINCHSEKKIRNVQLSNRDVDVMYTDEHFFLFISSMWDEKCWITWIMIIIMCIAHYDTSAWIGREKS